MVDNRKQREKFIELIGDGTVRRIRLTVVSVLALSGVVLQGLVWWYAVQMAREEWVPRECRSGLSPLAPGF